MSLSLFDLMLRPVLARVIQSTRCEVRTDEGRGVRRTCFSSRNRKESKQPSFWEDSSGSCHVISLVFSVFTSLPRFPSQSPFVDDCLASLTSKYPDFVSVSEYTALCNDLLMPPSLYTHLFHSICQLTFGQRA